MKEIIADKNLIAYCGLYCGGCKAYTHGKCPGCHENKKASWCKIRKCCIENGNASCADCKIHTTPEECKKFNNMISKIFSFIFGSDRPACIAMIKEKGYESYAEEMARRKTQAIKRR